MEERRTIAMRPGSTGLTPPTTSVAHPCLNCGTNVQLHYCPECGQRAIDPDPTLREFVGEAAEEFLHWDGKLLSTFRLLITRPGALTEEYLAGRRVRYISPLRVYLLCSVLFFFVQAVVPNHPRPTRIGSKGVATQVGVISVQQSDSSESVAQLDKMAKSTRPIDRFLGMHLGRAMRNTTELSRAVASNVPRMMFVLLPIFALLAALVFRDRRMRYPQHLTFALHVHAFMFLALTLSLVDRMGVPDPVKIACVASSFVIVATYVVLAIRRVYQVGTAAAIVRGAALTGVYFIAFVSAMIVVFAVVLLQF